MKTFAVILLLVCTASVSMGSSVRAGIEIFKRSTWSIEEAEQLKQIMPMSNDWLNNYIVAMKKGMTASIGVAIWLNPVDDPIRSAYVVKSNAEIVTLFDDGGGDFSSGINRLTEFYVSVSDLNAHWPIGNYVLHVTFADGHTQTWTTTVPDYNTTPFPDFVTGSSSVGAGGLLSLNWDTVSGVSYYDVWAIDMKKLKNVFNIESFHATPPQSNTTPLTGVYTGKGDYNITVRAEKVVTNGDFSVTFDSQTNWLSLKNPIPVKQNQIDKCTVTAGKDDKDSISLSGTLDAIEADFLLAMGQNVEVTLDSDLMKAPLLFSFPITNATLKKGVFKSTWAAKGGTFAFSFDSKTGKMTFSAKNVDLTGLADTLNVMIEVGDYGAKLQVDETVINGAKFCPTALMMGVQDGLDVIKFLPKRGKAAGTDSLSAQGTFNVIGEIQQPSNPFVLTLGSQTFTVTADKFPPLKNGVVTCTNATVQEGGLASVKLDTNTGLFSIAVKNVSITNYGVVKFDLNLFGFPLLGIETVNLGDPFVGKRTITLYGNNNISEGFTLDEKESSKPIIATNNGIDYTIKVPGILTFSMIKKSANLLALNPQPQYFPIGINPNVYMLSDGTNGAFVLTGQENYNPLDISVRVSTWTRPAVVTGAKLAGTWNTTWIYDDNLMDDVLKPFSTADGTFIITDLGNNQVKLDLGGGITWVLNIVGNNLVPTGPQTFLNSRIDHFSMVTDGNGIALTWIGVDTNNPTIISARIALAAR